MELEEKIAQLKLEEENKLKQDGEKFKLGKDHIAEQEVQLLVKESITRSNKNDRQRI